MNNGIRKWGRAAAGAALLAAGCGGQRADHSGRVVIAIQQEPDMLFSPGTSMLYSNQVLSMLTHCLTTVDDKLQIVPDLATEVPSVRNGGVSPDGKTVTFHLRRDAKWHDGNPVTSKDVRFTWKCVMDPKTQTISRDGFDQIDSVDLPDDYTAVFHLKNPFAPFVASVFNGANSGGHVLPEHILSKSADVNKDAFRRGPLGNGPFVFEKWESGSYITGKRFDAYFRGTSTVEQVLFKFLPDENTMLTQLKTGEIDVMQVVDPKKVEVAEKVPGVSIHSVRSLTWEHVAINTRKGPLSDKRVRQALAYALNKNEIRTAVYQDRWEVADTLLSPQLWAHNPNVNKYSYDPAKAKSLLEEAGWKPGADGVRVNAKGEKLHLVFSTTAGRKPREDVQQILQRRWHEVGIEIEIRNYPGANLFANYHEGGVLQTGKYDLALYAWTMSTDPDLRNLLHSDQIPPNGQNTYFFSTPELDKLWIEGRGIVDQAKRKPVYDKIQEILAEECPIIPTLYWVEFVAARTRIQNVKPNPTGAGHYWNIWDWKLTGK